MRSCACFRIQKNLCQLGVMPARSALLERKILLFELCRIWQTFSMIFQNNFLNVELRTSVLDQDVGESLRIEAVRRRKGGGKCSWDQSFFWCPVVTCVKFQSQVVLPTTDQKSNDESWGDNVSEYVSGSVNTKIAKISTPKEYCLCGLRRMRRCVVGRREVGFGSPSGFPSALSFYGFFAPFVMCDYNHGFVQGRWVSGLLVLLLDNTAMQYGINKAVQYPCDLRGGAWGWHDVM